MTETQKTRAIVVTGTDTDIGKTVFAAALTGALGAHYWKPVQAGLEADGGDRDRVARLSGLPTDRMLPDAYRLTTPCSPHRAAEIDGVTIDPARLALPQVPGPLVVEGAGGVLVPLTGAATYADLFARWGAPVVLVARTALGTINHSLLSIEALRARGVDLIGVAFVGDRVEDSEATICAIGQVRRLGRLPRIDPLTPASLRAAFAQTFDWRILHGEHGSSIWHPFTQHGLGEPIPLVERAEGALLHTADGRAVHRCHLVLVGDDARPLPPAHHGRDRRSGAAARPDHLRRLDARTGRNAGARPARDHARTR